MMASEKKYVIAADQGTSSSRAIVFDREQNIVAASSHELASSFPQDGWVEQDPMEIYSSQVSAISEAVAKSGMDEASIAAIGITNQRETAIVWERDTGKPIFNAIVWQCRRTAPECERLMAEGFSQTVLDKTGLVIDAYFSATKYSWILDNVPGARDRAERGELLCGTVDSWLIYRMTGGKVHVTDRTNASRTMLYDISRLCWDEELCRIMRVPMSMLPKVVPSSGVVGTCALSGAQIPIAGIAGDQQAALFGQACFEKGEGKNTYGTGCFLLVNTGKERVASKNGLVRTIAATAGEEVAYALEGSVFVGGALVQWLRDELGLVEEARDTEYFAAKVPDSGGVYIVPAFTGLGAPYWDMYARGTIVGLTRGTGRNHIIRAALESIAYQSNAVVAAIQSDLGMALRELRVDGGASANGVLMQFQADISNMPVVRPAIQETTALGAAFLAGLAVGFWPDQATLKGMARVDATFVPHMDGERRSALVAGFERAVECSLGWAR